MNLHADGMNQARKNAWHVQVIKAGQDTGLEKLDMHHLNRLWQRLQREQTGKRNIIPYPGNGSRRHIVQYTSTELSNSCCRR